MNATDGRSGAADGRAWGARRFYALLAVGLALCPAWYRLGYETAAPGAAPEPPRRPPDRRDEGA